MKKFYLLSLALVASICSFSQVKSSYLYNTSMPYGTLDIRTKISSTNYFYLQEGKTFSYRENSGVRTNSYLDMTSFDSSPYQQGNLRRKNGTQDLFIMNYRLLQPLNYSSTYADGYPLLVLFHGAVERGNCYYNACYHSNWSYDPNLNSPAAPKTATHKLMNNDHNLSQGGKQHLDARNKAAGKLPNDPTVTGRMFPGFVLAPQMFNVWDSLSAQDAIRLVQLIAQKYNIDENRIYVHGLSIGGHAVYQAVKRASWLFAAAQPMSAINDASIRSQNQLAKVVHMPLWIFQGGTDKAPSPAYTKKIVSDYQNAGAVIRYTEYAGVGHTCWHKAFAEAEFYSWALKQSKTNISVSKGITNIQGTKYPKLMLAEGFFKYQWEKDGTIISGAASHTYIAKAPGKYRARFSRVANPTSSQWNKWSPVVTITNGAAARTAMASDSVDVVISEEDPRLEVFAYPNPSSTGSIRVHLSSGDVEKPVRVRFADPMGKALHDQVYLIEESQDGIDLSLPPSLPDGMYILKASQGVRSVNSKVIIKQ